MTVKTSGGVITIKQTQNLKREQTTTANCDSKMKLERIHLVLTLIVYNQTEL